jgi:putative ABC transport system permease protein
VQGTVSSYGLTPAGTTYAGRFFSDIEDRLGQNVTVIGWGVKKAMFPNEDPVGKTVKIKGFPFRIIGVIEQRGFLFLDFIDNQVFVPISTFNAVFGQSDFSYSVAIKAGNTRMMDIVRDEVVGYMREIRNLPPSSEDDFSINEMKAFETQTKQVRYYIWVTGIGLTALAFIVGAIGIMNIMFVSVTERTKEIGIRKAVGAKSAFILTQFLVEAAALCVAGALVAFPISMVLTFATRFVAISVLDFSAAEVVSPIIQFDLMGIAIGVAIVVGIIAGLAPAIRAASLDPVDALRYE